MAWTALILCTAKEINIPGEEEDDIPRGGEPAPAVPSQKEKTQGQISYSILYPLFAPWPGIDACGCTQLSHGEYDPTWHSRFLGPHRQIPPQLLTSSRPVDALMAYR